MATLKILIDDTLISEHPLVSESTIREIATLKSKIAQYEEAVELATSAVDSLETHVTTLTRLLEDDQGPVIPVGPTGPENPVIIQELIDRASNGDVIELPAGVYRQQMKFSAGKALTVKPEAGAEGRVLIDGRLKVQWNWNAEGDNTFTAHYPGFEKLWWWKDDDARGNFNSTYMYPVLATIGDTPLLWKPDGVLSDGSFHINSDPQNAGTIRVKLAAGQDLKDFQISPFPWLVWGDADCSGIELRDLIFRGCSNTGKTGMINTPGSNWTLVNVTAELANTIGIELGQGGEKAYMSSHGQGHVFKNVKALRNGQMGWWGSVKNGTFTSCENSENNWKGFDPWWEASIKLEGCEDCTFTNWRSVNNNGQGFWFDISNHRNTMDGLYAEGNMLAGLMVEHYGNDNAFKNLEIKNTRMADFDPATSWGVVTGILIQSNINRNTFENVAISGCEDGVRINNTDPRGDSNNNTFSGCTYNDVQHKIKILGELLSNQI